MFYRIAIETDQEVYLKWKSTPLTSLQALFQLLRHYHPRLHDSLRVFMASSCEELEDMLAKENSGGQFYQRARIPVRPWNRLP